MQKGGKDVGQTDIGIRGPDDRCRRCVGRHGAVSGASADSAEGDTAGRPADRNDGAAAATALLRPLRHLPALALPPVHPSLLPISVRAPALGYTATLVASRLQPARAPRNWSPRSRSARSRSPRSRPSRRRSPWLGAPWLGPSGFGPTWSSRRGTSLSRWPRRLWKHPLRHRGGSCRLRQRPLRRCARRPVR